MKFSLTVSSSGVSTLPITPYVPELFDALAGSRIHWTVNATSAEVNGVPSLQTTPSSRLYVTLLRSAARQTVVDRGDLFDQVRNQRAVRQGVGQRLEHERCAEGVLCAGRVVQAEVGDALPLEELELAAGAAGLTFGAFGRACRRILGAR